MQNKDAKSHGPHYKIARISDLSAIARTYGAVTIEPTDRVNDDCGCKCGVLVSIAHATGKIEIAHCRASDIESAICMIDVMALCNKANMKAGIY